MEALQRFDDSNHNSSVEKGQHLSVGVDDLTNSHIDRLSDNDEIMTDLSGEMGLNKENLSLNSNSLIEEAKKDIFDRSVQALREQSMNSSAELNIVDLLFTDSIQTNPESKPLPIRREKRRRKRPQKLVRDDITELANEIIRSQL